MNPSSHPSVPPPTPPSTPPPSAPALPPAHTLYSGKFLALVQQGHWEYVRRVNANGAVMVIAVTQDNQLVLVQEYRIPLQAHTIGLPAGISGDSGPESALQSAKRELLEETGFTASSWQYLLTGPSSPGLTTETVAFFLATGLQQISPGGGVENENISVRLVPLHAVHDWLMAQLALGYAVDPKIFMGLYFLNRLHHKLLA